MSLNGKYVDHVWASNVIVDFTTENPYIAEGSSLNIYSTTSLCFKFFLETDLLNRHCYCIIYSCNILRQSRYYLTIQSIRISAAPLPLSVESFSNMIFRIEWDMSGGKNMVKVERFFCFHLKLIISVQAKTLRYSQSADGNRNEEIDGQVAERKRVRRLQ